MQVHGEQGAGKGGLRGGQAGLEGARLAQGGHHDHLQAHNHHHLQWRRQLLQRAEQDMNPSVGEPPVHHKPGGWD